jgi:hypothetical protein
MSLADDIRTLMTGSLQSLDASHSYFSHTKVVWRLLEDVSLKGFKLAFLNPTTKVREDQDTLLRLKDRYVLGYLAPYTFQHFVSLFEAFVFDLLRLWLVAYPGSLSKRMLDFGTVLSAPDKASITLAVVDKELNELKYERVSDWFEYLEKIARLGCPRADEIERLAEIKATRDILVHNQGIANTIYVSKAGTHARYKDGETMEIPEPYHRQSWELIKKVIGDVSGAVLHKA